MKSFMSKFYRMLRKKVKYDYIVIIIKKLCIGIIFFFTESKEAKKQKENLKQKLKNEQRLTNITQIWTQEIIPNWNQMYNYE